MFLKPFDPINPKQILHKIPYKRSIYFLKKSNVLIFDMIILVEISVLLETAIRTDYDSHTVFHPMLCKKT